MSQQSKLRLLRRRYRLTLAEFAVEASISRVTLLKAEIGCPIPQAEAEKIWKVTERLDGGLIPLMIAIPEQEHIRQEKKELPR